MGAGRHAGRCDPAELQLRGRDVGRPRCRARSAHGVHGRGTPEHVAHRRPLVRRPTAATRWTIRARGSRAADRLLQRWLDPVGVEPQPRSRPRGLSRIAARARPSSPACEFLWVRSPTRTRGRGPAHLHVQGHRRTCMATSHRWRHCSRAVPLDAGEAPPVRIALSRAEPARGASVLRFAPPHAGPVNLARRDAGGRRVRSLASGTLAAGEQLRYAGMAATIPGTTRRRALLRAPEAGVARPGICLASPARRTSAGLGARTPPARDRVPANRSAASPRGCAGQRPR